MQITDHNVQSTEEWRPGVLTRMQVSAVTEAASLCIFEQWVAPGSGAHTHSHPVEEVLTVLDGHAELWLDGERETVSSGQSVIIPRQLARFSQYRKRDITHAGDTGRSILRGFLSRAVGSDDRVVRRKNVTSAIW